MSHRSSCAEYVLPEMWWGSITKSIDVAYYVITLCLHPIDMSCEARTGIEVNEACENKQQRYKYTRKVLTDECIWVEFTFISYPFFNWTWKVVELGVFDIVWTLSRMIEECTHTHMVVQHTSPSNSLWVHVHNLMSILKKNPSNSESGQCFIVYFAIVICIGSEQKSFTAWHIHTYSHTNTHVGSHCSSIRW